MNNKGFVFIETIVTTVVLMTTLVLMYSSYSRVITTEQKRLYHDDIAYVYKTKHIRDVLDLTLDYAKFNEAVSNRLQDMYMYVFNTESDIYKDNSLIVKAQELYKFYRLVYIKIEDIEELKECIKTRSEDDEICSNTLNFTNSYGYSYLEDYVLTIDVPIDDPDTNSYNGHEGILISLIYEAKNGETVDGGNHVINVGDQKYNECITKEVAGHNGHDIETTTQDEIADYYSDNSISFKMRCTNAYYLSWVYLW